MKSTGSGRDPPLVHNPNLTCVMASLGEPLVAVAAADSAEVLGREGRPVSPLAAILASLRQFRPSFWMLTISCLAVYGCVLPFNNVASSLLMERSYFRPTPNGCTLTHPDQCQNATNPPKGCRDGPYAPPLPDDITAHGKHYSPLTSDDVDCTSDEWKAGCTQAFCDKQNKAESQAAAAMSIPYIISAVASPFLGYAVDKFGGRAISALPAFAPNASAHPFLRALPMPCARSHIAQSRPSARSSSSRRTSHSGTR